MPESERSLKAFDLSQDADSSCSLPIPSEPPDIGNWFSSYVYESPSLDTSHVSRSSFIGGTEHEQKSLNVEGNNTGKERNFINPDIVAEKREKCSVEDEEQEDQYEIPDSYSLSLPSEPPDIRIWFSSYAYESPLLDTQSVVASPKEAEFMKEGLTVEGKLNEQVMCGENKPFKHDHIENDSPDKEHGRSPIKTFKLSVTHNESRNALEKEVKLPSNGNLQNTQHQKSPHQFLKTGFMEGKSNPMVHTENGDGLRPRNLMASCLTKMGTNDNENSGQVLAENDFVSTRRNRAAERNVLRMAGRQVAGCEALGHVIVPLLGERVITAERKPLSESTNFGVSNELEATNDGKWHCPRKRKPDLGPPSKQLRLERWVRRV